MCPSCIVDGQMIRAGGTSMAAPMISGTVALLLQCFPQLTPNQVKGMLMRNARLINNRYPAVEAYKTLEAAYYGRTAPISTGGLTPNDDRQPEHGRDRLHALVLEPLVLEHRADGLTADFARSSWSRSELELHRQRRHGRHALELEPLQLVHELGQVAGLGHRSRHSHTPSPDVDTRNLDEAPDGHAARRPLPYEPRPPKGRIRWAVTALAVACCAALPATAGASSARSQVIVQLDAGASADAVKAQVRDYGGRVTGDLPIINGFAAKLSDGAAASLQRFDGVRAVTKNAGGRAPGRQRLRAADAPTRRRSTRSRRGTSPTPTSPARTSAWPSSTPASPAR